MLRKLMLICILWLAIAGLDLTPTFLPSLKNDLDNLIRYRVSESDLEKILSSPSFKYIKFIRERTSPESVFLAFRMDTMPYYAERKIIRDTDDRLLDVYGAANKEEAIKLLQPFRISYWLEPKYPVVTLSRSYLSEIVSDPSRVRIVYAQEDFNVYRYFDPPTPYEKKSLSRDFLKVADGLWDQSKVQVAVESESFQVVEFAKAPHVYNYICTGPNGCDRSQINCLIKNETSRPQDFQFEFRADGFAIGRLLYENSSIEDPYTSSDYQLIFSWAAMGEEKTMAPLFQLPPGRCISRFMIQNINGGRMKVSSLKLYQIEYL